MGTGGFFPADKEARAWSWLLTPTTTDVKNTLIYTSTHPYERQFYIFFTFIYVTECSQYRQPMENIIFETDILYFLIRM
jgi:hypothetical protein